MKINFRLWNIEEKKYLYIGDSGVRYVLTPDGTVFDVKWGEFPNCVVCMFTGKYDRNNMPIYAGDILDDMLGAVDWDEENACWNLGMNAEKQTIIGNIYKYPVFDED